MKVIEILIGFSLLYAAFTQTVQLSSTYCICQVITNSHYEKWEMKGWDLQTCNANSGSLNKDRGILMGNWRLKGNCVWYDSSRPVYGLKSDKNNKFCSADNYGNGPFICNRQQLSEWEKFYIDFLQNGKITIESIVSRKYLGLINSPPQVAFSKDKTIMEMKIVEQPSPSSKKIAIKASLSQNLYLSVREDDKVGLSKNSDLWEKFILVKVT